MERAARTDASEVGREGIDGGSESSGIPEAGAGGTDGETDALSRDTVFGLLSATRRIDALAYLDENGDESDLSAVAEHVAGKENGVEPRNLSGKQRKRVWVSFHQNHLPKMDDANVIDYDKARGTIELRAEAGQLLRYLSFDPTQPGELDSAAGVRESTPLATLRTRLGEWASE